MTIEYPERFNGLTAALLSPAPAEATAVIYTQMAHAVGLAMQNIVSQQQTLTTINNAIATKALNLLADTNPAVALEQIRKQQDATTTTTVDALTRLADLARGTSPPPVPPTPRPPHAPEEEG